MANLSKALICSPDAPRQGFYVQFNPNTMEYSAGLSRSAHKGVSDRGGQSSAPEPQLQSSPLAEPKGALLSVRLFFHTYASAKSFTDVRSSVNRIRAFLPTSPGGGRSSSPKIKFAWGTLTHTGTLESFHVSYQMFAHDGTPVQAEVSISIRGEDPDVTAEAVNESMGPQTDTAQVQQEDTIPDSISWLFA